MPEDSKTGPAPSSEVLAEELAKARTRCAFYKLVIERYAESITQGEQKALPELRALVNPLDPSVQAVKKLLIEDHARSVSKGIEGAGEAFAYNYERHFPALAQRAFEFAHSLRPIQADLGVPFWLTLHDIWELRAGDPFDKAVFLCSLLLALDSPNARIRALELEGGLKHPVVLVEFQEHKWLLDASQKDGVREGPLERLLEAFTYEGKKVRHSLFEFNNQSYTEFPVEEAGQPPA